MNELRQDIVSGDWVVIATGRASRPDFLKQKKKNRKASPKSTCPFEDLHRSGNWPPLLAYPNEKSWKIVLIQNKYPALMKSNVCSTPFERDIYRGRTAVGNHDLLITRDHNKNLADLDAKTAEKLFEMFQAFHVMASRDRCAAYVTSFLNWGPAAGTSIWHPHYQVISLPIIPPHAAMALRGAESYMKKSGRCARCDIVKTERKMKTRVIAENKHGMLVAPYASKRPFEMSILPKQHSFSFREASRPVIKDMAALVRSSMLRMRKYLNDPDFNLYIHDAPLDKRDYSYHHWHIEIVPVNVVSPPGGFEASTIININVIDPDTAAAILRGKKI